MRGKPEALVAEDVWEAVAARLRPMSRTAAKKREDPAEEPDRLEGFSSPREVDRLFGHDAARAEFGEALTGGRLHHAWLLVGPEGVGKATLAYHLAREVLALREGDAAPQAPTADHPVFRKVAALAHPNLLLIRRSWNDKTKRYSQWIGVDEVRRLRSFLGHSAGEAGWRVVIVDRADDLNAERRQRAAEGSGRAAAAHAVPSGGDRRGTDSRHHPLPLPDTSCHRFSQSTIWRRPCGRRLSATITRSMPRRFPRHSR